MEKYFTVLKSNPLFNGIRLNEFPQVLSCMQAKVNNYEKGQIALIAGSEVTNIGIVVQGSVQITKEDSEGGQTILAQLDAGQMFGEVFACAQINSSPVTVTAAEKSDILFINYKKAITACTSACPFHNLLVENMLLLLAQKNLYLNQKLEILSKRTTRARLLLFLQQYGKQSKQITLPFTREELAKYLCVERSALSAEISKMQRDGIITCKGRNLTIYK